MDNLTEIRWHGRGGQGIVTATKLFCEAALEEGKYFQGFPEYGPERMGAPIKGFNRLSNHPITLHCQIYNPEVVVILDATLLEMENVAEGLVENGTLIINTNRPFNEIKDRLGDRKYNIFLLDALTISQEIFGEPLWWNMPMIGALAGATKLFSLKSVLNATKKIFSNKLNAEIIERNQKAIERGFQEVRQDIS